MHRLFISVIGMIASAGALLGATLNNTTTSATFDSLAVGLEYRVTVAGTWDGATVSLQTWNETLKTFVPAAIPTFNPSAASGTIIATGTKLKVTVNSPTSSTSLAVEYLRLPEGESLSKEKITTALGYEAASTSHVERIFNVSEYGALPSDGLSDSTAFQNAVDDAYSSGGGVVYIPSGTYDLARSLTPNDGGQYAAFYLRSNVTIRGDGMGLSILKAHQSDSGFSTSTIGTMYNQTNIRIERLTVDGNKSSISSGGENECINPKNPTNFIVSDCEIKNAPDDGIDVDSGADLLFQSLWVHDNGGNGIYPSGYSGKVTIQSCKVTNNAHARYALNPGQGDWNSVGGIVACYTGSLTSTYTVNECLLENNARDITAYNTGYASISNCHINNTTSGSTSLLINSRATISNCTFTANAGASARAIQVNSSGSLSISNSGFFVSGIAIYANSVGPGTIEVGSCEFFSGNGGRITINGIAGSWSIHDCRFRSTGGIRLESGSSVGGRIFNNQFDDESAIYSNVSTSTPIVVTNNTFLASSDGPESIRMFQGQIIARNNYGPRTTFRLAGSAPNTIEGNTFWSLTISNNPGNLIRFNNIASSISYLSGNESGQFWTGNIGSGAPVDPSPVRLASISGIDAKSTTPSTIFTVPTGKTAVITGAVVRCTSASAVSAACVLGMGANSGEDDIFSPISLSGLTSTGKAYSFTSTGASATLATGTTVKVGIDTAAIGTAQTLTIDLVGYLY